MSLTALIPDVAFDAQPTRCHVRFVSHAHADHLPPRSEPVLVASPATIRFLEVLRPKLQFNIVIPIRPGETIFLQSPPLSVTALDALHCAGSLMFLVETEGQRILYTGDTRIEPGKVEHLVAAKGVDVMAADATFFNPRWKFPLRSQAITEMLGLIRGCSTPETGVYIEADMLGCEVLMEAVARAFRCQVHIVDHLRHSMFASIDSLKPHLTDEPAATRFHFCQFQSLSFHVQQRMHSKHEALYIRPSAQWFGLQGGQQEISGNEGPVLKDGIWHVLFSMHCSYTELAALVHYIKPRSIIPLMPASAPPSGLEPASLSQLLEPPSGAVELSRNNSDSTTSSGSLSLGLLPEAKVLGQRSSSGEVKRLRLRIDTASEDDDLESYLPSSDVKRCRTESKKE